MRHRIRISLSAGVALVIAVTGTAAATNWGGPRDAGKSCDDVPETSQCVGENATHTIFFEATVDAELREEVVWVAANYTSVTDANLSIVTSTSGAT